MNITMENFKTTKYDVFSIFDDRWGLCTAGTPREYNTMTIGWGIIKHTITNLFFIFKA